MGKPKRSAFVCQRCGYQTPKWLGRCPECGQWDSLVEEIQDRALTPGSSASKAVPQPLDSIAAAEELRLKTGFREFDRTLGGGIVKGSLVLIGGDPGIGKSTLILQVLDRLALQGVRTLYLSGEESAQQIKLRANRLGVCAGGVYVLTETRIEACFEKLDLVNPALIAVDSIQTFYSEALSSVPGSVSQVREVAARFMHLAKTSAVSVFLIGHVTKEGAIAGPKVLEHLVDTVLYFEGDKGHVFRILRAVKNRYGATNELAVFEMKDSGLWEVDNPSRVFLQERPEGVPGSVVISCMEGTRPLLVEIQALVSSSALGMPRRTALGVDPNRISLLVAVLGKRMGLELGNQDIFVNVAGGLRVDEPAADLGIISAMMSSFLNRPVDRRTVFFGEVGLAGEVRGVAQPDLRLREAAKMGFSRGFLSARNVEGCVPRGGMQLFGITSIQELFETLF